jgi:hypothetical protein
VQHRHCTPNSATYTVPQAVSKNLPTMSEPNTPNALPTIPPKETTTVGVTNKVISVDDEEAFQVVDKRGNHPNDPKSTRSDHMQEKRRRQPAAAQSQIPL